ncbi:metallophosphoesterase family protein [Peribacillus deserti]|uniref:Phosphoesterase n=1 Tax=Peribacillus deserti TaxID=673318 RepID=A0A2N5M114_9BACI|nr:metallophosphoesterase [Peribacillus deserti]PLT28005.1 YfcE family phosphodiesterase [Peribacillus deserti]
MKIIVLSDTHMPRKGKALPKRLTDELPGADLIIHAGDWQTPEVYQELSQYGVVKGVYGNVDKEDIKNLFPDKQMIEAGGAKIGVVHGHGQRLTTEKRAMAAFEGEDVDLIIFGHSHIPVIKSIGGKLLFNPGSPTDKRRQALYSFGIIHIQEGRIHAEHVFFKDKTP